jgi:YfiR/HmsC-like
MAFPKPLNCSSSTLSKVFATVCTLGLALFLWSDVVHPQSAGEYQVKSVFLFNFAKYVEWPPDAFQDANTPLVIGVLGQDPFGSYLEDTLRGERINSRALVVQRYRSIGEIKRCHVLFISRSESDQLNQIVGQLKYRKILTVTDADGAQSGVMIRFVSEGSRIRFRINAEAAKAAHLTISSKLLRLG